MQDRVRFFSKEDLSLSYYLRMAESVVKEYSCGRTPTDINDYLEMYQITLFIENGICSDKWDEEMKNQILGYSSIVARYLHSLTSELLPSVYSSLIGFYSEVFWEVIDRFGIKNLIKKNALHGLLVEKPYVLREILECERLVKNNSKVLAELLKENEHAAEWLLACYVEDDRLSGRKRNLYIPSALSIEEKDAIISEYIDRPNANINYLRLIVFAKNTQDFKVSDKTRLKAQRKEREENQQILSGGNVMRTNYTVCMSEDKNAPIKDAKLENGHNPTFTYNSKFLLEQDPAGLMSYCAQVFEMTTRLGFITLISKNSENGVMEHLFSISAQHAYPTNISFKFNETFSWLQTEAMQNTLNRDGRTIEGMLTKFYESVLLDKFGYKSVNIEFAKESDSWKQKCLVALPLMENITRQYTLFAENGEIDPELLSIMSPMKVTNIPSSVKKKYFAIKGKPTDLWHLFYLFFSDQCMLTYVDPYKDSHYHCFFDLISNENDVNYNNYEDYQKNDLDYLRRNGYISISQNGTINVEKPKDILLLKQLYEYQACPYWYYDSVTQGSISEMADKGWLVEDNHLLTPCEQDYFSYYLNNEKFTNGPALRNRYMHGAAIGASETEHRRAYFRILNLIILLTLKIFEDLSMKKSLSETNLPNDVYKIGTIVHLQKIVKIYTYDQLISELDKKTDIKYISVPKKFWYGEGKAFVNDIDIVQNGYAIIPRGDNISEFFAFYINSGIARVALAKCDINKQSPLTIDELNALPISIIPIRYQVACALLEMLIDESIERCQAADKEKNDVMRRDLLVQMKEFICMEIMNPHVLHEAGIALLDPVTDLIAELLDITETLERMVTFVDRIVFKDDRNIMSIMKRARVVAQTIFEEMNSKGK